MQKVFKKSRNKYFTESDDKSITEYKRKKKNYNHYDDSEDYSDYKVKGLRQNKKFKNF